MRKRIFVLLFAGIFLLSACNIATEVDKETANTTEGNLANSTMSSSEVSIDKTDDMFTERDLEASFDIDKCTIIKLEGDYATFNSDTVNISSNTVIIKDEGTYIVSGELNNGMLAIDADDSDKLHLIFDNVNIHNNTSAALYIKEAEKVFITLKDSSMNSLSNGGEYITIDDEKIDGAVFSKQDLTINGTGSLTVTSPTGHGIVCKDDMVFTGGKYKIESSSHGIDANDSIRICNANLKITSGKDGMHVENEEDSTLGFTYINSGSITVDSQGDGISSSLYTTIDGGDFSIVSGGGSENGEEKSSEMYGGFMGRPPEFESSESVESEETTSMKGIKASGNLTINGGNIYVNSADDSIHSNSNVKISNGSLSMSSGDDGIHADESLVINGGKINVNDSYEGLEALNITINNGEISSVSSDDGINAAGGNDQSGFGGRENDTFGGNRGHGGPGGGAGGLSSNSNGSIKINGGDIYIESSGDAIDSNGYLEITDGFVELCGPTMGDTAVLDYDTYATISGGTFIGTGSHMMAQTFTDSHNQGVIAVSVGQQEANTEISITDNEGSSLLTHTPKLSYAILIYSNEKIVSGESYTLTVGDQTAEIVAD